MPLVSAFRPLVCAAVGLLLLVGLPAQPTVAQDLFVDDDTCPSTGSGTSGDPYCSIQTAVDNAAAGDVIDVAAGTYTEEVNVTEEVTINGPNAGVSPNDTNNPFDPNTGRTAEAVVRPPSASAAAFHLAADNITINGFTLDGDAGDDGTNDITFGVNNFDLDQSSYRTVTGFSITHTVIKSVDAYGIFICNNSNQCTGDVNDTEEGLTTGGVVSTNRFENIIDDGDGVGRAIGMTGDGIVETVTNNVFDIPNSRFGLQTQRLGYADGTNTLGTDQSPQTGADITIDISGNAIKVSNTGVYLNFHSEVGPNVLVENNLFRDSVAGILLRSTSNGGGAIRLVENNIFTEGSEGLVGVFVDQNMDLSPGGEKLEIIGGNIENVSDFGIWVASNSRLDRIERVSFADIGSHAVRVEGGGAPSELIALSGYDGSFDFTSVSGDVLNVESGSSARVIENDLSGGAFGGLSRLNFNGETTNLSGNWWGSADPSTVAGAVASDTVDYTPFLNSGDADGGTPGFQGEFSTLTTDSGSPQVGATTRQQEAVDLGATTVQVAQTDGTATYPTFEIDGTPFDFSTLTPPVRVDTLTFTTDPSGALPSFDATNVFVNNDITFDGSDGTITVTNGEIVVDPSVSSITNSPTFDVQNQFEGTAGTGNDTGWRILTSPRAQTGGDDLNDLDFSTNTGSILYTWDGATQSFVAGDNTSGTSLPSGKGFFLYFFDDGTETVAPGSPITLDVAGTLTAGSPFGSSDQFGTGNRSVTIPATPAGDPGDTGYLLGVPYAQSFDLSNLVLQGPGNPIGQNGEFKATVQAWDPVNNQFELITEDPGTGDQIAPWQGFWVERDQATTNDAEETLTFQSSGRTSGAPFIGRKAAGSEVGRLVVNLSLEDGGGQVLDESRARLYLRDGATVGEDAYDASRFAPPSSEYAQLSFIGSDQTRWAQLSLPMALSERTEVPLRAEAAGLSGTGVLTVPSQSGMPEGWTVGLVDTKRDTVVALGSETEYRFELSASKALTEKAEDSGPGGGPQAGTVSGRFRVRVAPSGTLPVELAGLEGQATDRGVQLTWRTASETNNAGFQIERRVAESGASGGWQEVGFVASRAEGGTSTAARSYQFADPDVPYAADAVTYRLRQVDTDGTASIVGETTVERGAVEALELLGTFPNPARSQATVRFAVPEQAEASEVQMRLYDVLGRQVRTVRSSVAPGRHEQSLDVSGLSSGVYVLRLQAGETAKTRRLTVVR